MDSEDDDYDLTGSEQDYDDVEREILEDLRKQRKRPHDPVQEVFGFSEEDADDEQDDVAELMRDSDIEGAEDDDRDLPNTMDWGSKRSTYYNTDFVDQDYSSYNAQEEEEARAEEEEARKIQLRLAKQMSEADFQLDDFPVASPASSDDEQGEGEVIHVTTDLNGLTARERRQLMHNESPEFVILTQDFRQHLNEVKVLITPVLNYVKNHNVTIVPALQFARIFHTVLTTFCSNVAFYLLLKVRRTSVKCHPVIKRLVQLKELIEQLTPRYEDYIRPQLEALLKRIRNGDAITVLNVAQRKAKLQILNKYNGGQQSEVGSEDDDDDDDDDGKEANGQEKDLAKQLNEEDGEEDEDEDEDEDGDARRGITYQMAKNKGLTPHRKKEVRNPRVKHRGKYRKALIRRKGAVRTVRKELQRYGGEMSGIKATVTKSVKFRT